jgi:hypothetical protein
MPRFFFHIQAPDKGLSRDELGLDFPDVETARREAVRAAQDLERVFAACGQYPHDYAIEVENDTGAVVFRLPFCETLRRSLPQFHLTYKVVGNNGLWQIFCGDEFVVAFAHRSAAEAMVWAMVEARCAEQKASQVLIEDELGWAKHLCRCFQAAPSGTLLS